MPDQNELNNQLEGIMQVKVNETEEALKEFKMQIDNKMVKLRQEFDMNFLRKLIDKKAEVTDV